MVLSLRRVLIIPYVALVVLLAATIGWLSYSTGRDAVTAILEQQLLETSARIRFAVDSRVVDASAALEVAFPKGTAAPESLRTALDELRTRFWIAVSLNTDSNDYVYYGNRSGQFVGVWQTSQDDAELRVRLKESEETVYHVKGVRRDAQSVRRDRSRYDPRERPWYIAAEAAADRDDSWTPVYSNFSSHELVVTHARRVHDVGGQFGGVVGVDISLRALNDFVRRLHLSRRGIAFIMEPDGGLIASSTGPYVTKQADGSVGRLNAAASGNPLIEHLFAEVSATISSSERTRLPQARVFENPDGEPVFAAFDRIEDDAGLDWIVVVAAPRGDFMDKVRGNVMGTVVAALAAAGLAVLIGLAIIDWVAQDLRRLSDAARKVGDGEFGWSVGIDRRDEIGALARSFEAMQERLRTDRLTGLANREALVRRIDGEILRRSHDKSLRPFGLLFVDLDRFKQVNDGYGHDAGDRMLIETGRRLEAITRPSDLVARQAGDEFVVFVDDGTDEHALRSLASRIEQALSEPMELPGGRFVACGASIGLAVFPEDGCDRASLLEKADQQMYRCKFEGRA